jgi:signal peptidase I
VPRENIIGRPLLIYWSVRAPAAADSSNTRDGRLSTFLYGVTHFLQDTRWDRTFRIVK